MSIVGIIPARGGSKGIPRKNLVPLANKPLIQYTIEAALASKYIGEIVVSSENDEIINFCESLDLAVPYRRPEYLATDYASITDVILDILNWIKENKKSLPKTIVLLQPTSPLRRTEDIDAAIEKYYQSGSHSLVSVNGMLEHPYECLRVKDGGWSYLAQPSIAAQRRQDYKEHFYFINGAIYIVDTEYFINNRLLVEENKTEIYIMDENESVDIDEPKDLLRAEFILSLPNTGLSKRG